MVSDVQLRPPSASGEWITEPDVIIDPQFNRESKLKLLIGSREVSL